MSEKNLKEDLNTAILLTNFADSTSAHGVQKLNSKQKIIRFLWFLLICTALGGFSYHLSTMVVKYLSKPVTSTISPTGTVFQYPDITICNKRNLAIGNMAYKNDTNIGDNDFRAQSQVNWTWSQPAASFLQQMKYFKLIIQHVGLPIVNRLIGGLSQDSSLYLQSMDDYLYNFGGRIVRDSSGPMRTSSFALSLQQMLLKCQFGPNACDLASFEVVNVAGYLSCAKFNLEIFKRENRVINLIKTDPLHLIFYTASNFVNTQEIASEIRETTDNYFSLYNNGGIDVFIHETGTYPTSGTKIVISNGYESTLTIYYKKLESINTKTNVCVDSFSQANITYTSPVVDGFFAESQYRYSKTDCENVLLQNERLETCSCFDYETPLDVELKGPDIQTTFCSNLTRAYEQITNSSKNNSTQFQKLLTQIISYFNKNNFTLPENSSEYRAFRQVIIQNYCAKDVGLKTQNLLATACPRKCSSVYYSVDNYLQTWPQRDTGLLTQQIRRLLLANVFYRNNDSNLNLTFVKSVNRGLYDTLVMGERGSASLAAENFVSLRVVVGDSSGRSYLTSESVSYELSDLFSDIGGILGLYVGVSVLTICELIELCVSLTVVNIALPRSTKIKSQI